MDTQISNIPSVLKETDRWVCWEEQMRDGKATKVPKSPVDGVDFASTNDSDTWGSFSDAIGALRGDGYDGIGFVFTEDGKFVGVDLDDCRDPETEEFEEWAIDVMETLDSFGEISPSGTGAHVIVEGEMPDGRNRRGDLEMYDDARFFTVTGDVVSKRGEPINDPRPITERTEALVDVADEYLYEDDEEPGEDRETVEVDIGDIDADNAEIDESQAGSGTLDGLPEDDQERLKQMFRRKRDVYELWHGSTAGYPSHSEADQALCNHLAYWLDKDPRRIDRAFRRSGLMRPKWTEDRGDNTYGELTIAEAIKRGASSTYSEDVDESEEADAGEEPDGGVEAGREPEPEAESSNADADAGRNNTQSRESDRGSRRRRGRGRDDGGQSSPAEDQNHPEQEPDEDRGQEPAVENATGKGSEEGGESQTGGVSREGRRRGRDRVDSLLSESENSGSGGSAQRTAEAGRNSPASRPESESNSDSDTAAGSTQAQSERSSVAQSEANIPNPDEISLEGSSQRSRNRRGEQQNGEGKQNNERGKDAETSPFNQLSNQSQEQQSSSRARGGRGGSQEQARQQDNESRTSANGKREIPSATEERVREFGFKLRELEEEIGRVEKELQNEHDMAYQKVEEAMNELRHYEDVVDELEGQVRVLSILLRHLCEQVDTPVARNIAAIAQERPADPAEIPTGELEQHSPSPEPRVQTEAEPIGRPDRNRAVEEPEQSDAADEDSGFLHALKNLGSQNR